MFSAENVRALDFSCTEYSLARRYRNTKLYSRSNSVRLDDGLLGADTAGVSDLSDTSLIYPTRLR
jgi:hypothetical protein